MWSVLIRDRQSETERGVMIWVSHFFDDQKSARKFYRKMINSGVDINDMEINDGSILQ